MQFQVISQPNNKFTYRVTFAKGTKWKRTASFDTFEEAQKRANELERNMKLEQLKSPNSLVFPFEMNGKVLFTRDMSDELTDSNGDLVI